MSRELIQIFIGQAGCQIGDACWELFAQEHGISAEGKFRLIEPTYERSMFRDSDCFFEEGKQGKFSPRAILIDTEPSVIDEVRSGYYRNMFHSSSLISGDEDSASNFARGYFNTSQKITTQYADALRSLIERCDQVQGIIFYRASGGGTGSGLGCSLIMHASNEFIKVPRIDVSIVPSNALTSGPVEPYNAVLSCEIPIEEVDLAILMDNQAMQNICCNKLGVTKPTFSNLNRLIAQNISGMTASFRFKGPVTISIADLRTNLVPYPCAHFALCGFAPYINVNDIGKMNPVTISIADLRTNLVPYPCAHFALCGFAPYINVNDIGKMNIDTFQLTTSVFSNGNQMITHANMQPVYLSCCMIYRGNVSMRDANMALVNLRQSGELPWVDWCPTGFKMGINNQPMTCVSASRLGSCDCSVVALHNSTLFKDTVHQLLNSVRILLCKKAFLHWYEYEGLEAEQIHFAMDRLECLEIDYNSFIEDTSGSLHKQLAHNQYECECNVPIEDIDSSIGNWTADEFQTQNRTISENVGEKTKNTHPRHSSVIRGNENLIKMLKINLISIPAKQSHHRYPSRIHMKEEDKTISINSNETPSAFDRLHPLKKETEASKQRRKRSCQDLKEGDFKHTTNSHFGKKRISKTKSKKIFSQKPTSNESTSSVSSRLNEYELRQKVRKTVESELDDALNDLIN